MSRNHDSKSELRSTFTNRGFRNAKHYLPSGSSGVFIQVTQAVIFMYLIVMSYTLMDVVGLVLVSTLFLIALLSPFLLKAGTALWNKHKQQSAVADGQPTFPVALNWTPTVAGSYTLELRAYNSLGAVSAPRSVTLT